MVRVRVVRRLLVIGLSILGLLLFTVPGYGQSDGWPPFDFRLVPSYQEDGKIKYEIEVRSDGDWRASDLTVKILLPPGTSYIESSSFQPNVDLSFDGQEITVFNATFNQVLADTSFLVEITDVDQTVFTTHAWISWKGDQAGDYLSDEVSIDVTRQPLDWEEPYSYLSLGFSASSDGELITFTFRPQNQHWLRMWDLVINTPIPAQSTLLATEAPPTFVTSSDELEVSFSTIELAAETDVGPLRFTTSVPQTEGDLLLTRSYAHWRNEGWQVGALYPEEGALNSGYLVLKPGEPQVAMSDPVGDVPFPFYDITTVAFEPQAENLKVTYFVMADFSTSPDHVEFFLYLDTDCRAETGQVYWGSGQGIDYVLAYDTLDGAAYLEEWVGNEAEEWRFVSQLSLSAPAGGSDVTIWIPYELLASSGPICWSAESAFNTDQYAPDPPPDIVTGDEYSRVSILGTE